MRGASADSLASLLEALGSAVDAGADANRVAEDLLGVAAILRREPGLRRIATDVSVASRAKQELMRQVFGEQLDATSLDLVAQAAGRRWAGSRDLADALEHVGVVAVVRAAGRAGTADRLEDELFAFEQTLTDNPSLRDALSDPARSTTDKRALLRSLLEGKVTGETIRLAEQAVSGSHRTVNVAVQEYQKVAARHRQRVVATVHVARELSERDAERLSSALAAQYERPVHLNTVVDPDVIGGLRVEVGDEVIDGTVASRLAEARRRLAG
jgi:F-type H+-transporting ATPase subunit delta